MLKKSVRLIAVFLLIACLVTVTFGVSAATQVPFESYTYWEDIGSERKAVYSRPMYQTEQVIGAQTLGIAAFTTIQDVFSDDEKVYILDVNSRIVILDSDYNLYREIGEVVDETGKTYNYAKASSLFVYSDGTIFICDTENQRVLHIDEYGNLIEIYAVPVSPLIPKGFVYKPLKAVMDSHGYLYVLSDGSYYGALLYAPDKTFTGFYGANNVTTGIATAIQGILERVFPNNDKKGASVRKLPYSFVDIVIDSSDFIYTATGKTSTFDRKGQIKKLNPGTGNNILRSEEVNFVDDKFNTTVNNGTELEQDIVGLDVTDNGFIFCVESQFGRVFLYDRSSRMLTAFGGGLQNGTQEGTFVAANAITLKGDHVIVSDKLKNTITVFTPTEFGAKVMALIDITLEGKYLEAEAGWREVIALDRNFQPAYSALARAELTHGNYKAAMEIAQEGYDRETYALAFEFYRQQLLEEYFWVIALVVALIAIFGVLFYLLVVKKGRKVIKNKQVRLMFNSVLHPFNTFEEIKEKKQGSITICVVLIILFYITAVMQVLSGGFLFTQYDPATFNSLWVLLRSAGLVLLFVISNWMICTLMQGKGTMREITIVTSYSLLPIIIERFIYILLTNVLLPTEAMFLTGLEVVAIGIAGFMIIVGLMKIHDFEMPKLIWTSFLTIVWMAVLVFLMILVGMLIQQLGGFVLTVFLELIS